MVCNFCFHYVLCWQPSVLYCVCGWWFGIMIEIVLKTKITFLGTFGHYIPSDKLQQNLKINQIQCWSWNCNVQGERSGAIYHIVRINDISKLFIRHDVILTTKWIEPFSLQINMALNQNVYFPFKSRLFNDFSWWICALINYNLYCVTVCL